MKKGKNNMFPKVFIILFVALVITTSSVIAAVSYRPGNVPGVIPEIEIQKIGTYEVTETEEYISNNIDENYASALKMEPADVLVVKQTFAEDALLKGDKTIDAMWSDYGEAFIIMNEVTVRLYNTDDNSDYYVAYADTMHDSNDTYVSDYEFAYTNKNGEVITDAYYDAKTGLSYIPKKYKQENKNGVGLLNVQLQLLQVSSVTLPTNNVELSVLKDSNLEGTFCESGVITENVTKGYVSIELAKDEVARNNVRNYEIAVKVNGVNVKNYEYNNGNGVLTINDSSAAMDTIEVSISKANISVNDEIEKVVGNDNNDGLISGQASTADMEAWNTVWELSSVPQAGAVIDINDPGVTVRYYDDRRDVPRGTSVYGYGTGQTENEMKLLVNSILDGSSIPSVSKVYVYMQFIASMPNLVVRDNNGIEYVMPPVSYDLKCAHVKSFAQHTSFTDHRLRLRIFEVQDNYLIVGFVSAYTHTQSGAAVYKIPYRIAAGKLKIVKNDVHGQPVAGVKFHVTGNGVDSDYWTDGNGEVNIPNLKPGDYCVTELEAPYGLINDNNDSKVQWKHINGGDEQVVYRTNSYPTGSVQLLKYDEDHRGATLGDAKLEGATYQLFAKNDIYQGNYRAVLANQLMGTVTTDANGYTGVISNLPVGEYYFVEQTASVGFLKNTENIPVTVDYVDCNTPVIPTKVCEGKEKPIYANLRIHKTLGATDCDPESNLKGARFRLTLNSNPNQVYYTSYSDDYGMATVENVPYGTYTVTEDVVPNSAYKIADFQVSLTENGHTYSEYKVDSSKMQRIQIDKRMLLRPGEKTDAKVSGAIFTVYRDEACTRQVCTIGPTDANGYALSATMRTGTYYVKETTFPEGVDPDKVMANSNVTYKNKVYTITSDNAIQGNDVVTEVLVVQNEPKRHDTTITKKISATSNTREAPLDKCEFTATLISSKGTSEPFSRKCTAETDANGYCIIEDLPYGNYEIEETKVSPISLKCDNYNVFIEKDRKEKSSPYSTEIVDVAKVMQLKTRKVDANRTESDSPSMTQGDAKLNGAIYQIYRYDPKTDAYTEYVYDVTVDHKDAQGYWCAESRDLLVGKYMVVEKVKATETTDNGTVVNYSYAEGYLADPTEYYYEQRPDLQTGRITYHTKTSEEEVIRGTAEIVKFDNIMNSTKNAASEGAVLRLSLKSNKNVYYLLTIDSRGNGEFVEEKSRAEYYPYTIPYGEYEITEDSASIHEQHTSFNIIPETVIIEKQEQSEYRIEADEPVKMYLKIQKNDAERNTRVRMAGSRFKIWRIASDNYPEGWVTQYDTENDENIDVFEVGPDGNFTTPAKVTAGEYIIYEVESPNGYYLEDTLRVPENEEDIGIVGKGGKYVKIDKAAMELKENEIYNTLDLYYTVEMADNPLKSQLEIIKTGDMLVDTKVMTNEWGEEYTPVYEQRPLEGVTFEVYAAEDIIYPDGVGVAESKDQRVDTIVTDANGYTKTRELYPGKYYYKEVDAPEGYLVDETPKYVTLVSTNPLNRVNIQSAENENPKQKLQIEVEKIFEETGYVLEDEEEKEAIFGVYASEPIMGVEGNMIIPADGLLGIIEFNGNEMTSNVLEVPEGDYYIRELYASYPYSASEEVHYVTTKGDKSNRETIVFDGGEFINTQPTKELYFVKFSVSSFADVGEKGLNGVIANMQTVDKQLELFLSETRSMTLAEIKEYIAQKELLTVTGAKYELYTDEECQKPVRLLDGTQVVATSENSGFYSVSNLPLGTYYLKETEAPVSVNGNNVVKYIPADKPIKIVLKEEDSIQDRIALRAICDEATVFPVINKTDIFTGEAVANCTFELLNEQKEVIYHATTDENGLGGIPMDMINNGETYYLHEIDAPSVYKKDGKLYEVNDELHKFVADYRYEDGQIKFADPIAVQNYRPTSNVLVQKIDKETGKPLQGCKFTIVKIDENGNEYVNSKGEVIYAVKDAVTDENGEYLVENVPVGSYRFIEVEAPEGYELEEQELEGLEFTVYEDSPETIYFQVVNTGDIAVYVISAIAVISLIGIVFITTKKLRRN